MKPQNQTLPSGFSSFGREVEEEGLRSLDLLRAIDKTISSVNRLAAQLHADAGFAEKLISALKDINDEIDPEGSISEQLEKAQTTVNKLYDNLIIRRESSREDERLSDEDGIEDAYTEVIAAAADLQNNLNDLRWAINEHDADLSKTSKTYTNAKELLKDLAA